MIVIEETVAGQRVTINVLETAVEDAAVLWDWFTAHGGDLLGLDTETTGLDIYAKDFRIRLLQIGTDRESWVFPMDDPLRFRGTVRKVLNQAERFVLHNAAYDLQVIEKTLGVPMSTMWPKVTDTSILAHLYDPRDKKEGGLGKSLEELIRYHVDEHAADTIKGQIPDLCKDYKATKATIWKKVDQFDRKYLTYSGMDPVFALLLHDKVRPMVPVVSEGLIAFEHEVARVCVEMEKTGFLLDTEYTLALRDQLKLAESQAKEIAASFGCDKVGSTNEVADVLEQFGITITGRTPSGDRKVDDAFLQEVISAGGQAGEFAAAVIEAKRKSKQRSSWVDTFLRTRDANDRVHPHINPLVARTARMSITNPATQTLPAGKGQWHVRRCFVADEGHRIASVDYSSQELRVLAALSGDRTMTQALLRGDDLHLLTAQAAFGPHITKDSDERKYGKATNFSKVYGGGAKSIAEKQGISFPVAKRIVDAFDATYKEVPVLSQKLQAEATKTGHVVTPTGRRLPVDADRAYSALNYVIQSTSRDVTASALLRLDDAGFTPYLRLPIHDEVLCSLPEERAEWGAAEIGRIMAYQMGSMPITTDPEVGGRSWGSLYGADY